LTHSAIGAKLEISVTFSVPTYSILWKTPTQMALPILMDTRIRSNIKPTHSLTKPLKVAIDNGARHTLLPIANKRQSLEFNPDVLERIDLIFFSDLRQAAFKALGLD
jgi:ATP-dependent Lon protease